MARRLSEIFTGAAIRRCLSRVDGCYRGICVFAADAARTWRTPSDPSSRARCGCSLAVPRGRSRTEDWRWVEPFLVAAAPSATEMNSSAAMKLGAGADAAPTGDTADTSAVVFPRTGLILLNTPLAASQLRLFWPLADFRVCADGAANRLSNTCMDLIPDLVVGDFDSVDDNVLEKFRHQGVEIQDLREDQDSTDLDKALAASKARGCERFIVSGEHAGVDGRLDHTFGIANTLHTHGDLPIAVVGAQSYLCLLNPGEHVLPVPNAAQAPHCGLVPLGQPCKSISSRGLRWELSDHEMAFGGLVSVCNRVEPGCGGRVWVKTSDPVLWMCQL